jgi:hypothetical protein
LHKTYQFHHVAPFTYTPRGIFYNGGWILCIPDGGGEDAVIVKVGIGASSVITPLAAGWWRLSANIPLRGIKGRLSPGEETA